MQEKLKIIKGIREEVAADGTPLNPEIITDQTREKVMQAATDFKNCWRTLAVALNVVSNNKLYEAWGYDTFDDYVTKEVKIKKATAAKLLISYRFLRAQEPQYFKPPQKDANGVELEVEVKKELPSLEAVDILKKAKTNLEEKQYKKVRNDIIEEERDLSDVKRDLTSMIKDRRRQADPDEERIRKDKVVISKFVSNLRSFRKEVELTHMLPGEVCDKIGDLILKIESIVAQNETRVNLLK
jgi:hypothetical protein